MRLPLYNLKSFGTYQFPAHRSAVKSIPASVKTSFAPVFGRVYLLDRLGRSRASLDSNEWTWTYFVTSDDYSPAAGQELAAVQTQLEALYTFLDGPANADGSSSQVQTLVAVNGDTTTTVSTIARLLKISMTELTWHTATLELTFAIEGDFA